MANKVIFTGRLTDDVKLTETNGGKPKGDVYIGGQKRI